jgi:calmodulin
MARLRTLLTLIALSLAHASDDDCPQSTLLVQVKVGMVNLVEGKQSHTAAGKAIQTEGLVLSANQSHTPPGKAVRTEGLVVLAKPREEDVSPSLTMITQYACSFLIFLVFLDVGGHMADQYIKDAKRRLVIDHLIDAAAACIGLIVSFIWYSLVQEFILQHKYPSGDEFPDASFLILFDRLFAVAVSGLAFVIAGSSIQWQPSMWAAGPGVLDWLSSYLIDKSVVYLAYNVVTVFKCSKVVPTMVCNTLINGEKHGIRDYVLAVLICAGVFGFKQFNSGSSSSSPSEGPMLGTILVIAGLIADALTSTTEKWIFRKYDGFSHMEMIFSTSIVGGMVGFIACLCTSSFSTLFLFLSQNPAALAHMFMMATGATLGVYFIFYLIDHHGPVTLAIALLVKQILSVYISALLYHHTVTAAASAFAVLTFMAVLARPVLKYFEDSAVPLKTGALRKGLNFTAQARAQLGHEIQASATILLAAARLKAVLIKNGPTADKDSFALASKAAFDKFDQDGSGKIDRDELGQVLSSLGHDHTSEELDAIMAEIDADGDGSIALAEFTSMLKSLTSKKNEDDLREAFQVFDEDHSGSISSDELRHVMANIGEKLSEEDITKVLEEVDVDKDGEISFSEFTKMMED